MQKAAQGTYRRWKWSSIAAEVTCTYVGLPKLLRRIPVTDLESIHCHPSQLAQLLQLRDSQSIHRTVYK
jgi:hypothetical protein